MNPADTLADRIKALEDKLANLTVPDLPLAALQRKLENDWHPDPALLFGSATATGLKVVGPTTRNVAFDVNYQPSTERPTLVLASLGANAGSQVDVYMDGLAAPTTRIAIVGSNGAWESVTFIVPTAARYRFVIGAAAPNILDNQTREYALGA